MMALHLGVMNGGGNMVDIHGVTAKVRYPDRPGGDICTWLYVCAFGYVQIVSYDVGVCNINMVIDPGEVD